MSKYIDEIISRAPAAYIQSADPAIANPTYMAVDVLWLDTSSAPSVLKKRNATNDGWDTLGKIRTDAQFTEDVEDAVGNLFAGDSTDLDATYNDAGAAESIIIKNDAVTNAKSADMAQATIKGRASGAGTGDPTDLTGTQATVILDTVVGDSGSGGTKGLVPAPAAGDAAAGKFLKADGNFAVPPGTGISGVTVRKNSGSDVGTRSRVNLIEGANITLTVTDDAGNDEVDVTIEADSGAVNGAWDGEVIKSGDQTVTNNATPQNDTELFFSMDAAGLYEIEFVIAYSGNNTTGDYRWRFSFSALADAVHSQGYISDLSGGDSSQLSNAVGTTTQWPGADRVPGVSADDAIRFAHGKFLINNSSGGANTLQFQFANAAASSGRTSTTRAGSRIRWRKLN